jgi:hypothetical protein
MSANQYIMNMKGFASGVAAARKKIW